MVKSWIVECIGDQESYLVRTHGEKWREYQRIVGFLIPFVRFKSIALEGVFSIIIPIIILHLLLRLPIIL